MCVQHAHLTTNLWAPSRFSASSFLLGEVEMTVTCAQGGGGTDAQGGLKTGTTQEPAGCAGGGTMWAAHGGKWASLRPAPQRKANKWRTQTSRGQRRPMSDDSAPNWVNQAGFVS